MLPGIHNLTINKGAYFTRLIRWLDAAGSAVDVSTFSAEFKAKPLETSTAYTIEWDSSTEIDVVSLGSTGYIRIAVAATVTDGLDFSRLVYHLDLIDTSNPTKPFRILIGNLYLDRT